MFAQAAGTSKQMRPHDGPRATAECVSGRAVEVALKHDANAGLDPRASAVHGAAASFHGRPDELPTRAFTVAWLETRS